MGQVGLLSLKSFRLTLRKNVAKNKDFVILLNMLVTCPECSNKVSHAAVSCPQCGLNKPGAFSEEKAMEKAKLWRHYIGMERGACFDHLSTKIYNKIYNLTIDELGTVGGKPTYITDVQVVKVNITKGGRLLEVDMMWNSP